MMTEPQPPQEPLEAQPVQPLMAEAQLAAPPPIKPHRGTLIFVLGLVGMLGCMPLGIVAWVLADSDLREMQAELMDRSGEGMTKAGKVLGIISVILTCLGAALYVLRGLLTVAAGS